MLTSFTDSVQIGEPRMTRGGYMIVDARAARTGIQAYAGHELGRPELGVVRVYRPESEVFDKAALASFAHVPVTNDHPSQSVDAGNWREHAVGYTGDTIVRDGDHVRIPFMLMDQAIIDKVKAGKRELSAGYTGEIVFGDGVTPEGEPYEATLAKIRADHLAVVFRGRAGASCRIGDAWPTETTPSQHKETRIMPDNLRTLLVDGISISITDQGAQAVEKLQRMLTDAETRISAKDGEMAALTSSRISAIQAKDAEMIVAANAHANAIQAKDAEMAVAANAHAGVIAAKDAEIARLAALTDAASIDAQIEARAAVIATTRRTLGDSFDPKGKSITDMQAAVVTKRLGDAAVAGRPPEFFAAAFDTLALADAANPSVDPLRVIVASGVTEPVVLADKRMSYEERKANAWKGSK